MNTKTVTIQARAFSCRCGCHGQDPWHKPNYKRIVHNVIEQTPVINDTDRVMKTITAVGEADFPWGKEPVVCEQHTFDGKLISTPDWRLTVLKR